jgi:hypothetical protein
MSSRRAFAAAALIHFEAIAAVDEQREWIV